jgi:hypothetical protein
MIVRKGTIRNGQVVVDEPINLPDGSEVTITGCADSKFLGEEDNDRPPTPEEIARVLAAMEKVQPFEMTPEEEAEIEAHRRRNKAYTIANMHKGIEELFP